MDALRGVHDEANEVDLLDRAARDLLHEGTEPAGGRVEPGRVDEDDLRTREVLDAGDPVARRLWARRDDRELLAHEAIQEGRLARVRAADERNEPCAGHCNGRREAGAIGGWPETRHDSAALRIALLIPDQLREPGGVRPADLVIANDEDLDGAPGPPHRREGRARRPRQTRRPDGDTPLTIRDRHRHQVPSAAFPLSRVRVSWTSYARTIADTSRWRTTSPSSK